jgi:hypothetical protein
MRLQGFFCSSSIRQREGVVMVKLRGSSIPVALAVWVSMAATPSFGQWPSYPALGIPRLPDGKPNLAAPAPRTADGKPDLSGMWQVESSAVVNGLALNVAQDLGPEDVQPWAQAMYQQRLYDLGKDSPMARCLPRGLPALNSFPAVLTRIVQAPGLIVILYLTEPNDTFRTIFMDGRKLPEAPDPTWLGYSIGRWEGDTLVVATNGFNDRAWLDFSGHPQTESLSMTERLRRRDFGHLDYEMTLNDAKVFRRPIPLRMNKVLAPDVATSETICENERDVPHLVGGNGFRLKPEDLPKYAGTYEFAPGREITVTIAEDFLMVQAGANRPKRVIIPQSETRFVFRNEGGEVEFVIGASGAVTQLILHGDGNDRKAVRKGIAK